MPRRLALTLVALSCAVAPALAQDQPVPEQPVPEQPVPGTPVPAPAAPAAPAAPERAPEPGAKEPVAAPEWFGDFDRAAAAAHASKKDLLVNFTGSDWCHWCKQLHKEVFEQDEFTKAAPLHFVLVALDFPEAPEIQARVPNPQRNQELAQKYRVSGFPTVLLLTAEGDAYAQLGYRPGGAAKWVEELSKARERGRALLLDAMAVRRVFADAKGDARSEVVTRALDLVEKAGDGDVWVEQVLPAARAALEVDPANEKGLKLRAVKALLASGTADGAILEAALTLDPRNEMGLKEVAVAAQVAAVHDEESVKSAAKAIEDLDAAGAIRDLERKRIFYANLAFWNRQNFHDTAKAKAWAEKLKAITDPQDERFRPILDAILGAPAPKSPETKAPEPAPEPAK
jgi:protein disulfide-isomerase